MVRWHATRGVSVIDFARSVVMINGILHLPQLSAMPALTEYGRRLEDPHPRGQVVQVSGRTIASCFKAITREFISNSKRGFLFLSLSLSLAIYGSFPQSLFDHAEAKPLGYFVHAKPKTCQVAELAEHTPPKQNFASSRLHTLFYVVVYFIAKRCAPSN